MKHYNVTKIIYYVQKLMHTKQLQYKGVCQYMSSVIQYVVFTKKQRTCCTWN